MSWLDKILETWDSKIRLRNGKLIQIIEPKRVPNKKDRLFVYPCYPLCTHNLRRPHLSCLTCRTRRVWAKKMPSEIEVSIYTLYIWKNRRFRTIKSWLLKWLLTIAEMLAN